MLFTDANFIYFNLVERYDKFKDLKFIEDFITYQPKNVILYALAGKNNQRLIVLILFQ